MSSSSWKVVVLTVVCEQAHPYRFKPDDDAREIRMTSARQIVEEVLGEAHGARVSARNDAPAIQPLKLSGPRAGITFLSPGIREVVEDVTGETVLPVISQFGGQWETRLFSVDGGLTGVSEWVLLMGGLEQSHLLPSLTWILGVRSAGGHEIGVGPNLTAAGTALAVAGGVTLRSGPIFIPLNLAVVPSRSGVRVSVLTGFNMNRGGDR